MWPRDSMLLAAMVKHGETPLKHLAGTWHVEIFDL